MTTADTTGRVRTPKPGGHFRFPDPPEIPEDKITSFNQLTLNGNVHHLIQHLGDPENTLVAGEHFLAVAPTSDMTGVRYPDLLVGLRSGIRRPTTAATPTSSRSRASRRTSCWR